MIKFKLTKTPNFQKKKNRPFENRTHERGVKKQNWNYPIDLIFFTHCSVLPLYDLCFFAIKFTEYLRLFVCSNIREKEKKGLWLLARKWIIRRVESAYTSYKSGESHQRGYYIFPRLFVVIVDVSRRRRGKLLHDCFVSAFLFLWH